MSDTALTEQSLALFLWYAEDAGNWGGLPWLSGNRDFTAADRGNLTQLKKAGLLRTQEHEPGQAYIQFTAKGAELAAEHGIDISEYVEG